MDSRQAGGHGAQQPRRPAPEAGQQAADVPDAPPVRGVGGSFAQGSSLVGPWKGVALFDYAVGVFGGVDGAGRGPLAVPVFAAAGILDPAKPIAGLRDSKKLSPARRDELALVIQRDALAWSIAQCSAAEIDALNILQATMLAMRRAIEGLSVKPTLALIDGNRCPVTTIRTDAIIKGYDKVIEISAASILAKTARDSLLRERHER